MKYEFILPTLFAGITADEAAAELERIRQKYGVLDPSLVVEESRHEENVLHKIFCWDDERAAELYRKQQARNLIRNIRVIVTNKNVDIAVRAFVNVRPMAGAYRSYMPTQEVIENDEAYKDLLEQARGDMEDFITKYAQIEELNPVKAEMLKELAK